jgi:hypothetical protein
LKCALKPNEERDSFSFRWTSVSLLRNLGRDEDDG